MSGTIAHVGEIYHFRYPKEPQFNKDLTVTRVSGPWPKDMVHFEDGTMFRQENLINVPKTIPEKP